MFGTIRDLIKNETVVAITIGGTTFEDSKIIDVDDLFIKFEYPHNGLVYIYPLDEIVQIRFPISP